MTMILSNRFKLSPNNEPKRSISRVMNRCSRERLARMKPRTWREFHSEYGAEGSLSLSHAHCFNFGPYIILAVILFRNMIYGAREIKGSYHLRAAHGVRLIVPAADCTRTAQS